MQLRGAAERLIADPAGGRITLDNDIDLGAKGLAFFNSTSETPIGEITLDLNSHMLRGTDTSIYGMDALIISANQTALNIENGALELKNTKTTNPNKGAIFSVNGILRLKNCTVNSVYSVAVVAQSSSVEIENCNLKGGSDLSSNRNIITVLAQGATITANNVTVENYFGVDNDTPWSLTLKAGGTYSFDGRTVPATEDTTYSAETATLPRWITLY